MRTDVITLCGGVNRVELALEQASKMAAYKGLKGRDALHLQLLTEEMVGMMQSITGETKASFWIEDEDGEYRLHLQAATGMNSEKREKLLSISSTGKNESARGLMGRLRDLFERGADEDVITCSRELAPGVYGNDPSSVIDWDWSMMRYEDAIFAGMRSNDIEARKAWDELEKSVVAHVADEIRVSIRGRTVEMTVIKKMQA